jgi:hypothetical protein
MIHIFYTIGLLLTLNSLMMAFGFWSIQEDLERIKKLNNTIDDDSSWSDMSSEHKWLGIKGCLIVFGLIIWLFFGVFTDQWVVFLSYIILLLVSSKISKLLGGYKEDAWFFKRVYKPLWHLFNASLFLFLVINYYHLHIDVSGIAIQEIRQLFDI